jgi:caa(3)-type oxidase subunit IV
MAESHGAEGHHSDSGVTVYLVIFAALAVFTAVSFLVNQLVPSKTAQFVIILGVAVCKAVLVAMFFMHLKWDWGRLYFMIFPVLILGTMMVIVLLPDIVLAWHH